MPNALVALARRLHDVRRVGLTSFAWIVTLAVG
jgi:hypothetical protein